MQGGVHKAKAVVMRVWVPHQDHLPLADARYPALADSTLSDHWSPWLLPHSIETGPQQFQGVWGRPPSLKASLDSGQTFSHFSEQWLNELCFTDEKVQAQKQWPSETVCPHCSHCLLTEPTMKALATAMGLPLQPSRVHPQGQEPTLPSMSVPCLLDHISGDTGRAGPEADFLSCLYTGPGTSALLSLWEVRQAISTRMNRKLLEGSTIKLCSHNLLLVGGH